MRVKFIVLILIFSIFPIYSQANLSTSNTYIPFFSVDEKITKLLKKSETSTSNKYTLLTHAESLIKASNPAEKYVLYIIKANLATGLDKHHKIINILDNVDVIEKQMNTEQLDTLPFLNVHKKRAESYASIGQFKKAYKEKQLFIEKYNAFLLYQKNKHIFDLETKYETKKKRDINKLLNNQTILKELEINDTLSNEVIQKRNLYILSAVVIMFLFLLLRLSVINRRTRSLAKQDMLTGLYNRKTLFKEGEKVILQCVNNKESLCLLAVYIDDFKKMNHQYGDYIGDEILKKLASIGRESMRTRDIFARLEDAKFIAVLPQSSVGEVKAIAQHIKEKFTLTSFNYVGISQPIGLSLGIVEMQESGQPFEVLLNAGMNVLYDLKDDDGNGVSIYQGF